MTSHIPGLHGTAQNGDRDLEGLFLVRVDRAFYRWHPQEPSFALRPCIFEPKEYTDRTISGELYSKFRSRSRRRWTYDPDVLPAPGEPAKATKAR